jgi:hypothetical protein
MPVIWEFARLYTIPRGISTLPVPRRPSRNIAQEL